MATYYFTLSPDRLPKTEEERQAHLLKARAELEEARRKRAQWEDQFSRLMRMREEASGIEEFGDLALASERYETAIAFGVSCSLNPMDYYGCWERLLVIYRKLKRYADEERVILAMLAVCVSRSEKAPDYFGRKIEKLEARLVKCRTLLSKSQSDE